MKKERVCLTLLLGLNLKLIIIEINKVSNQQVMIEDLFPTLLAVAQGERSILAEHQLDSIDFRQLWCDTMLNVQRPVVFHYLHICGPDGPDYDPHSALRMDN
jgi:hypothetical protein